MSTIFIGIDPGMNGGVGVLKDGKLIQYYPMPETRKELYAKLAVYGTLAKYSQSYIGITAVVEAVNSMPKQGVASMFKFGKGYGEILGICTALGFRILEPRPQAWKKVMLAGTDKSKDAAIQVCENLYPEVELVLPRCRKPHDGMAEAILLARYGEKEVSREG